jgi:hypothetical protein
MASMTKENPGFQTWQVARKYLEVKILCRLYGVKARTIYDYHRIHQQKREPRRTLFSDVTIF